MRSPAPSSRAFRVLRGLTCLALLACGAAGAQVEPGPATVLVGDDLRRSPGDRAAVVGSVSAGDAVEVLEIRGDQARVEADGDRGWMPLDKLGAVGEPAGSGAAGASTWLGGLGGVLAGRDRSRHDPSRTVTLGVRGLQREDLADAQPDPQAVERLEAWRATPEDGEAYGRGSGLQSRDVDYREARR